MKNAEQMLGILLGWAGGIRFRCSSAESAGEQRLLLPFESSNL